MNAQGRSRRRLRSRVGLKKTDESLWQKQFSSPRMTWTASRTFDEMESLFDHFPFFAENSQENKINEISNYLKAVDAIREQHKVNQHALQVEINLAPEPLEFSAKLNKLMKEEMKRSKIPRSSLSDRIDSLLRRQLHSYFRRAYDRILSRWAALDRKHSRDWEHVGRIVAKFSSTPFEPKRNYSLVEHIKRMRLHESSFEARVQYYDDQAAARYYLNEKHNLHCATKLQLERLNNDWTVQLKSIEDEYEQLRHNIEPNTESARGKICPASPINRDLNDEDSMVGSPSSSLPPTPSVLAHSMLSAHKSAVLRPTKRKKKLAVETHMVNVQDESRKKALNELNLRFQDALADVSREQASAVRMINRQATRLLLQLEFEIETNVKVEKIKRRDSHTADHLRDILVNYRTKIQNAKTKRPQTTA